MRPSRLLALPLLLAAGFLTACGGAAMPCSDNAITGLACEPPAGTGDPVAGQRVVAFEPEGSVAVPGTFSDAPVDPDVVRGWLAAKSGAGISEPRAPKPATPAEEGMAYVAVSRTTGCQKTDKAELRRQGDELISVFTGTGSVPGECVRAYTAYAQFAVPKASVTGVKKIDGQPVVDAAGPGKQIAFVPIAGLDETRFAPVFLRDDKAKSLREEFVAHGASESDVVVLDEPTPAGKERVAYLLDGCAEKKARLLVSPTVLQAELVRDTTIDCDGNVRFLVVFELDAKDVPQGAMPAVWGQR
ncbi:hypothetical protein Afil01_46550 [Actinorhabdospora filicis]|uniref:Lipoprotein n=1 Tax=Actinorhabdospora filicis TaxID=1785913 RepID=A0A9W6SP81_9ACTN|nr:hypothetical protein [Actinorhabdospora filicis]GLZ79848.1 hypothetical protein Afil01_46550 [Actinorhabdospora filicis]